jgi:prolyl-tRNA synthetase
MTASLVARRSRVFLPTRASAPRDDEARIASHKLLLQAGFIRRMAPGVYSLLPAAQRVLGKLTAVVEQEMASVGAERVAMTTLLPAGIWQQSGRWTSAGDEMFRLRDRRHADFCLGPTHEEAVCTIFRDALRDGERRLPLRLFQIAAKFRDEVRPRFGLMRAREFLMKDLYTCDLDSPAARHTYDQVVAAYARVFDRIGFAGHYRFALADTGHIGGDYSHELHVLAPVGEDELLHCDRCDYTANVERAESRVPLPADAPADRFTLSVAAIGDAAAASRRVALIAPRAVQPTMLLRAVRQADAAALSAHLVRDSPPAPLADSTDLSGYEAILIDPSAAQCDAVRRLVAAAGRPAFDGVAFGVAQANDLHSCGGTLHSRRGIECGQAFILGDKYSKPFDVTLNGKPLEMGCYGLGMSRILAAAIEVHHDRHGMRWPAALAPYVTTVVVAAPQDELVVSAAEQVAGALGDDVLIDDRTDVNLQTKMREALLIGSPRVVVVGKAAVNASERTIDVIDRFQDGDKARKVSIDAILQSAAGGVQETKQQQN